MRDAAAGRACVLTGVQTDRIVPQHRQGGMGGRKDKHRLPNLLWLDSLLNGFIESDAEWAAIAKAYGVKVPIWVKDVSTVPVFYAAELTWFVLEGDGRREVTPAQALDMMLEVYGDDYLLSKAVADGTDRARALYLRSVR
jgi:hypothetical protein